MRLLVAALLLLGGPARASDALSRLFSQGVSVDETAAGSLPERGQKLARLSADLTLAAQGLEAFRSQADAERALKLASSRVPPELRPRFSSRDRALDALYRTMAVVDYTWATRSSGENCSAVKRRARLLASDDGLFKDPETGKASAWTDHLLGPDASGGVEAALDNASSADVPSGRAYELLRAKAAKATAALEAAPEDKRAWLYCLRAETYESLARANAATSGPIAASRSSLSSDGVAMIGRLSNGVFEARGAGVLLRTQSGPRVLTDSRLVGDGDEYLAAFPGSAKPVEVRVERRDGALALLVSARDLGEPRALADADPAQDDLVTVVAHSERLGAWAQTQGLVTQAQDGAFQTDAVVDSAQAGGPVFGEDGRVAGILAYRQALYANGQGEWPVGVPASVIRAWLDGGALQTAGAPIELRDNGTSSIIQASYIYSDTQWGTVRGKCMNCGGGGGSSYSGGSSGGAAMGQALGEAMAPAVEALLFKGIPALFGGLFNSKPSAKPRAQAPARVEKPRPPPPPSARCELRAESAPTKIGAEAFEVSVTIDCQGARVPLADHTVTFAFEWDGKKVPETIRTATDRGGRAVVALRVENEETKRLLVRQAAEDSHAQLDSYDPEVRDPDEPEESWRARRTPRTSGEGLIETGSEARGVSEARSSAASDAVTTTLARPLVLRGTGVALRITATAALSPGAAAGASVVVSLVVAKAVFDIGWEAGTVAEKAISEIQRGHKRDGRTDCKKASGWQLRVAGIESEHDFKRDWLATPPSRYDICACKDGSIIIKGVGICGNPGPFIWTDARWIR
jgi:hypothetical protein